MLDFEILLNGLRKFTQYISHLQTILADIQLQRIRDPAVKDKIEADEQKPTGNYYSYAHF